MPLLAEANRPQHECIPFVARLRSSIGAGGLFLHAFGAEALFDPASGIFDSQANRGLGQGGLGGNASRRHAIDIPQADHAPQVRRQRLHAMADGVDFFSQLGRRSGIIRIGQDVLCQFRIEVLGALSSGPSLARDVASYRRKPRPKRPSFGVEGSQRPKCPDESFLNQVIGVGMRKTATKKVDLYPARVGLVQSAARGCVARQGSFDQLPLLFVHALPRVRCVGGFSHHAYPHVNARIVFPRFPGDRVWLAGQQHG